ncbi:glycosyltransferase family 2 protein [Streptococcus sp. zg-JUN1979]|uniref:glycosyltransferase family 2 protein n=1 Tax=Streptococcus sp. zg-JUN1979 TaxID=3391450 RepID=UPI0039A77FFB
METVSVIVPVYNAEDYLEQCLESIIHQTYANLEIILINDGSTDTSGAICEAYREKDSRIRLYHKKLGGSGVGATRNTALSFVTGDYVLFVDNDDWLEPNHIELLYQSLKANDADIAIANFTSFFDERQTFGFHVTEKDFYEAVYTPQEWFSYQYDGHFCLSQCFTVPWSKLYKRHLFDSVVYPEDEKVEDDYTTWKLYLAAHKIVFSNRAIYYHRKRETSVTKTVDRVAVFPIKSIEERISVLASLGMDISQELRAYRYRLEMHRDSYLELGDMYHYHQCLLKLRLLS